MLVRSANGELASCAEEALDRTSGDPRFVAELRATQIELVSRPCLSASDLGRELASSRCDLADALPMGVRALAVATHPTASTFGRITDGERYRTIAADHPWAARHMLTCGLHVHVNVAGADRALAVYNSLRSYLPELSALAANSPFHLAQDAGVSSARAQLTRYLPRSGTPPAFRSWAEFAAYIVWGTRGGAVPDPSYHWWGVRLHPAFGTLEIRICDVQTEVEDAMALAAFSQALVAWLLDRYDLGEPLPVHDSHLIEENLALAARDAMGGWLIDLDSGRRVPTVDRVETLLDVLTPFSAALGSEHELERVAALAWVNGAERQRQFVAEQGIGALTDWLAELTDESARRGRAEALSPLGGAARAGPPPRDRAPALIVPLER
jgi:carboxylate-amine ligase